MLRDEIEKRRTIIVNKINSLRGMLEAEVIKNRQLVEDDPRDEIIGNLRSENARLLGEIDVLAAQVQSGRAKDAGPLRDSLWKVSGELSRIRSELDEAMKSSELLDHFRKKTDDLSVENAQLRQRLELLRHERDSLRARLAELDGGRRPD